MTTKIKEKRLSPKSALAAGEVFLIKRSRSWYDRLSLEDREWLNEIKREWKSGSAQHLPMSAVRKVVNHNLNMSIGDQAFRKWMQG